MKKSELLAMVVNDLKTLAKKMKVSLPSGAKKSEIVTALASAFTKQNKKTATGKGASTKKPAARKRTPAKKPVEAPPAAAPVHEWKLPPGVEEPLMAQERVSDAKYYTGPAPEPKASQPYEDLPAGYGEEKIAIMVRDPYLLHAYWEVTPSRINREKAWLGLDSKLAVRIYDVTGVQFDGRNANGLFDQVVSERIGSWYFDIGRPLHSFIADIGLLSAQGRFLTLARSNYLTTPRDGVSDVIDEEWMLVDEEFWKLYGFPGGPSSPNIQEMIKKRRRVGLQQEQITSPGTFGRTWAKRKQ